jgi:hypothetical protein
VLYLVSHATSPFCFSYFSDRVLHFCPGLAWALDPLPYASQEAGITAMNHHARLICWDGGLALNCDPPDLPTLVAAITGLA